VRTEPKATAYAETGRSVRYNWLRFSLRNVPGSFGPMADSLEQSKQAAVTRQYSRFVGDVEWVGDLVVGQFENLDSFEVSPAFRALAGSRADSVKAIATMHA